MWFFSLLTVRVQIHYCSKVWGQLDFLREISTFIQYVTVRCGWSESSEGYWREELCESLPQTEPDCCRGCNSETRNIRYCGTHKWKLKGIITWKISFSVQRGNAVALFSQNSGRLLTSLKGDKTPKPSFFWMRPENVQMFDSKKKKTLTFQVKLKEHEKNKKKACHTRLKTWRNRRVLWLLGLWMLVLSKFT